MKYFFLCVALATFAIGLDVSPIPVTTIEPGTTETETVPKETATEGPTTTEAATETTTSTPDFECPGLGPYPNPVSNKSYYYCISNDAGGYIAIKLACGKGTEYIPEMGTCGVPGEIGSTTPNPGTEGTTVEPEPFVCPGPGLYPNPVDKTKFYYCLSDGEGGYIPIPLECGAGSEFNPEKEECEKPEETTTSTASTDTTPSQETTSSTTTSSTTTSSTTEQTSTTTTTTELPESTTTTSVSSTTESPTTPGQFKCTTEGIFADPMDQTRYYYCLPDANGGYREVVNTCPLGLVFNSEKKYCSFPDKPFITSTSAPITTTTPTAFACTRNGMFPDPKDNRSFYMCIFDGFGFISVTMQCHQGLVFIPALYRCALPDTPLPPPSSIQCNEVGYYPDPSSCRDYYYCYPTFDGGYIAMKMKCPPGTNFFANMQICVSDKVLECGTDNGEGSGEHHDDFQCTGEGDFPILGNDRRYYSCDRAADGTYTLRVKQCPIRFSIFLLRCVNELGL